MTTLIEKTAPASRSGLPKALEEFVHDSIQSMNKKELRALKRDSAKIMRKAKRGSDARSAGCEIPRSKSATR